MIYFYYILVTLLIIRTVHIIVNSFYDLKNMLLRIFFITFFIDLYDVISDIIDDYRD